MAEGTYGHVKNVVATGRLTSQQVRRCITDFTPTGGCILAAAHNIHQDEPPENVVAMFDEALALVRGASH